MLPFHSGSLCRVSLFGSLYFTVCKNRYTHFLIIPRYSVGSSAVKKAKCDCSFFKFFLSNNSGIRYFQYFQVAKVSDLIFLFSRFLIDVLRNSRTTVLCCRILIFWSNLALNIVSTARNDLCFTLCFGSHNWIRNVKSPGKSGSASLPRAMKLGNGAC